MAVYNIAFYGQKSDYALLKESLEKTYQSDGKNEINLVDISEMEPEEINATAFHSIAYYGDIHESDKAEVLKIK